MSTRNPERTNIGENFLSGLPVRAPIGTPNQILARYKGMVVWFKEEKCFVLRQWNGQEWREVLCVVEGEK